MLMIQTCIIYYGRPLAFLQITILQTLCIVFVSNIINEYCCMDQYTPTLAGYREQSREKRHGSIYRHIAIYNNKGNNLLVFPP